MDLDKEELEATRNRGKDINKSIAVLKRLRDETKEAIKCIYITDNKQWKEEAEALDQALAYIEKLEKKIKAAINQCKINSKELYEEEGCLGYCEYVNEIKEILEKLE